MSVVIVGGNERMEDQYKTICKEHGCKAKIYTKERGGLRKKIGSPDLLIFFTDTLSHKMLLSASKEAKKNKIPVAHLHSASACALEKFFNEMPSAARKDQ